MMRFCDVDVGKRRRIDGAAMQTCATCNVDVPANYMSAHQRTVQHRNNSCSPMSDGVQLMHSAFKNRIATYRINSDNVHLDYLAFFSEIKVKVLNLINELLRVHHVLKINMVAVGMYFLQSQDTFSEKSFNTSNEIVTLESDMDAVYQHFIEIMKTQSTEFQEKDSGMLKKIYN